MAQWLKAFVALAEDLNSVPSTHMMVHNHPKTLVPRDQAPTLTSYRYQAHMQYTHTAADKTLIYIKEKKAAVST